MLKYLFVFLVLLILKVNSQSTTGCGEIFSCFKYPRDCVDRNCDYIYKWSDNGDSNHFIISTKISNWNDKNYWMAIGFSYDRIMGKDQLVTCKTTDEVEQYYNPSNKPFWLNITQKSIGITKKSVQKLNGWFVCSFKRNKSSNLLENYFNLTQKKYYILAAKGEIQEFNGVTDLQKHSSNTVSENQFSFTGFPLASRYSEDVIITPIINSNTSDECGKTKGCFFEPYGCKDTNCSYIYKFSQNGDYIDFELKSYYLNNAADKSWLAIGFSYDDLMGNDNVVLCTSSGLIEHRYNNLEKSLPDFLDDLHPSIGLKNTKVTKENGWLSCSFARHVNLKGVQNYFDLNKNYVILAASGYYDEKTNQIYGHDRQYADSAFTNFSSFQIRGKKSSFDKYKAHGCLMVIAWVLFATTGILIARYYKFLAPNSEMCGVSLWFFLHRPIMLIATSLSVAGFVIILSKLNWNWVSMNNKYAFSHSICGIVAIGISVLQPIIAFLRCEKNHKKRFLFNYVHRFLGILAVICSIAAMILGSLIDKMFLSYYGWSILVGWAIWVLILPNIIEIIDAVYGEKELAHSYSVNEEKKSLTIAQKIKKVFLAFHLIVALGVTGVLVFLISMPDIFKKDV